MIFLGDIAIPNHEFADLLDRPKCFGEDIVVANLEGTISNNTKKKYLNKNIVFNTKEAVNYLKKINTKVVCLANNHVLDIKENLHGTLKELEKNSIHYCGVGDNILMAQKPARVEWNGIKYCFLSFGWDVIGCQYAKKNRCGVNPLEKENVIKCIDYCKKSYVEDKIIIIFHWDYELEIYPMPMHRTLAKEVIDHGAEIVVGHHSHCVQGIENYKGKYIIYSLGNWLMPNGIYMQGRLKFPKYAHRECAIEWNGEDKLLCHWFWFRPDTQQIIYDKTEDAKKSAEIKKLSSFTDMTNKEYSAWFRDNRKKRILLPVFDSFDSVEMFAKKKWLKVRGIIISILWSLHIRNARTDVNIAHR